MAADRFDYPSLASGGANGALEDVLVQMMASPYTRARVLGNLLGRKYPLPSPTHGRGRARGMLGRGQDAQ